MYSIMNYCRIYEIILSIFSWPGNNRMMIKHVINNQVYLISLLFSCKNSAL